MASIPAALAARLAKRGLIGQGQRPKPENNYVAEEAEEVIAEDYDDIGKPEASRSVPNFDVKLLDSCVPGCPNKNNIYHNCTGYCAKRYADVPEDPSREVRRKFARLLKKYPINRPWEKVYEPGLKTFYFWNTKTDQVSWLPPSHPDAKITLAAEKLRRLLREDIENSEDEDAKSSDSDGSNDSDDESGDSSDSSSSSSEEEAVLPPKAKRQRQQAISRRNDIDPMDPAAYSNIPRGKWSDGLHNRDD